ncbi:MAG: hypothetical protein SPJ55_12805 [Treponema sp.]|nr:hypothetical protein [Treponema sp.]
MFLKHYLPYQWIFTDNYSFAILIEDEEDAFFGRIFHTSNCKMSKSMLSLALRENTRSIAKVINKDVTFRYYDYQLVNSNFIVGL